VNKIQTKLNHKRYMTGLAGLVLGSLIFLVPGSAFGQEEYKGAEYCKNCHETEYNKWTASGHPYKLMKGQEAKHRPIPLPGGFNWPESDVLVPGDVSYVIGGYKWKSRYIDHEGYIITTTCEEKEPFDQGCTERPGVNQYNYLTGEWVDYHAGEEKKPYDCGVCHTTNWVQDEDAETDNDLTDNQDGLPGMWGTFDDGGIHCEQCHGNNGGDGHMTGTDRIDSSAAACGACHYREASPDAEVNVIPAGGGFIKHHEQYNEHLAGPHANMECVTCHDPHKRGEFSIKEGGTCKTCHGAINTTYMQSPMAGYGVECKDCHMPYASKSANQLGPFEGDIQTHLFYINTDDTASMFTPDGAYVALDFAVPGKPDRINKGATTLDFACKRCHETAEMTELGKFAKNFHGTDTAVSELEYIGLNPGLTGNWWGGPDRNSEGFMLEVAEAAGALTLIVSMYTYDQDGNQVWLLAIGPATTGMTSDATLYITEGRKWGEGSNTSDFTKVFGTGTFTFPACDVGTFTVTPNAEYMALGFTDIGYDLQRDGVDYQVACPAFDNDAN
jgi:hypothetical protein